MTNWSAIRSKRVNDLSHDDINIYIYITMYDLYELSHNMEARRSHLTMVVREETDIFTSIIISSLRYLYTRRCRYSRKPERLVFCLYGNGPRRLKR